MYCEEFVLVSLKKTYKTQALLQQRSNTRTTETNSETTKALQKQNSSDPGILSVWIGKTIKEVQRNIHEAKYVKKKIIKIYDL